MTIEELKAEIALLIGPNGQQAITGQILQDVLLDSVDTIDGAMVHKTGEEYIYGRKVFSDLTVQFESLIDGADSESLETKLAAKADNASVVHLAGDEIVAGAKTFSEQATFSNGANFQGDLLIDFGYLLDENGISLGSHLEDKQDTISDLDDIRVNAATGASIAEFVPEQASPLNELADKAFVNSSIDNIAAFFITKNAAGEPFATKAELTAATTFYSGGQVRVPTRNDYCVVLADESKTIAETGENPTTRYIYDNGVWSYQYIVNRSGLTAAQWAAVNSGITAAEVQRLAGLTDKVFVAVYGVTTFAEIKAALDAGKIVFISKSDIIYRAVYHTSSLIVFTCTNANPRVLYISVSSSNSWADGSFYLETTSNKTTSLSPASTNTQYPSAKAVKDYVDEHSGDREWEELVDYTTDEAVMAVTFLAGDNGQVFDDYDKIMVYMLLQPTSASVTGIKMSINGDAPWAGKYLLGQNASSANVPKDNAVGILLILEKSPLGIISSMRSASANSTTIRQYLSTITNTVQSLGVELSDGKVLFDAQFVQIGIGCYTGTPIEPNCRFLIYGKK